MLTYLVNNRARRKMKVYLYSARSSDDALACIRQYVLGCEGNAFYLDADTYRLLTRRASNSKITELNGPLRQLNPLNPLTRAHG